ncbi:MAG: HIT family protein [Dysgonamonadaceae bacterium]|jgi:histidine triad (HIT) family protein|nr:HIT family protein [Dysgonamonadaceae bacterium]
MSIFRKIINGEIPSYKVAEDERFYAFLDIHPVAQGHVLVVPKKETDYLFDLDDDTLSGMILFSKRLAHAMKEVIACKRIAVTVIGLEVPHAHIHLIPINKESDCSFNGPRKELTPQAFEETARLIANAYV